MAQRASIRNTGRLPAARARLVAAEMAYAALRRAHGSSMVSWAEFKRAVAGMSPAAILAETQAALSNPKRKNPACAIGERVTLADGRRGTVTAFRNGGMVDIDVGRGVVLRQPIATLTLTHTRGSK